MSIPTVYKIGRFGPNRKASELYTLLVEKLPNHVFVEDGDRLILDCGKIADDIGIKNKQTVSYWVKHNTIPAIRIYGLTQIQGSKLKEADLLPYMTRR